MMTLASTAIDQVAVDADTVRDNCLRYLFTDSALFFASEEERALLRMQKKHYSPLQQWARRSLGVDLAASSDMRGRVQHQPQVRPKLHRVLGLLDPFSLTCLQCATMESKSILVALALLGRELTLEQAIAASRVEEEFQIEIWGAVEGGHDMDRLNNAVALSSVDVFMRLLWDEKACKDAIAQWRAA